MKILAIETSCDETAISILKTSGSIEKPSFNPLADLVLSQINIHSQYGGVFPALAKREHAKNIIPLIKEALKKANLSSKKITVIESLKKDFDEIFTHEEELAKKTLDFLKKTGTPDIDIIAVTYGPGLEPALWVGINTAKALSKAWNKPVVAVNHLEGHIASVLFNKQQNEEKKQPKLPTVALIISGGHTELIGIEKWGKYKFLGGTVDDAVGEAYDKVARMLDLPYPGGPPLSKLAQNARESKKENPFIFPRPMQNSGDLNLSFSGLKTAVLYTVKKQTNINKEQRNFIASAFEDAVADVLTLKTEKAIKKHNYQSLIVCGGVSANSFLRNRFQDLAQKMSIPLFIPDINLSTDNAFMISLAAFLNIKTNSSNVLKDQEKIKELKAEGNLRLG
jgi:N6-L-threonylcarbamoyladenine synthase